MKKYKCICCGNFTMNSEKKGTYDICPVCFWENDIIQSDDPTYRGGANEISLFEARANYKKFGAVSEKYLSKVREPTEDELADTNTENP